MIFVLILSIERLTYLFCDASFSVVGWMKRPVHSVMVLQPIPYLINPIRTPTTDHKEGSSLFPWTDNSFELIYWGLLAPKNLWYYIFQHIKQEKRHPLALGFLFPSSLVYLTPRYPDPHDDSKLAWSTNDMRIGCVSCHCLDNVQDMWALAYF